MSLFSSFSVDVETWASLLRWVVVEKSHSEALLPGKVGGGRHVAPVFLSPLLCEQGSCQHNILLQSLAPWAVCLKVHEAKEAPKLSQTLTALQPEQNEPRVRCPFLPQWLSVCLTGKPR